MDISHFYLERGAGEPLILLHGNGEDSSYFFNQMDAFSAAYHVFALDTRGHGKTTVWTRQTFLVFLTEQTLP